MTAPPTTPPPDAERLCARWGEPRTEYEITPAEDAPGGRDEWHFGPCACLMEVEDEPE